MIREIIGSRPEIRWTPEGMSTSCKYECYWWEKEFYAMQLAGSPHPYYPGLVAVDIVAKPRKPDCLYQPWIPGREHDLAVLDVQYVSGVEMSDTPKSSIQMMTETLEVAEGRVWTSDGEPCDDSSITRQIQVMEETVTTVVYGMWIPTSEIETCQNKLNSNWWRNRAPGTVLCIGANVDSEWSPMRGCWKFTVNAKFQYKSDPPFNYAWRPDTGAFDTTTPLLYNSTNFDVLGYG